MSAYETIKKKRDGLKLTADDIRDFILGYAHGEIPDYMASSFLMAVFTKGMDDEETLWLTEAMMESGETFDLSSIPGFKIDKHSTGGVGDKVSIVLAPLAAACGLKVPMISGRGLGHTGGTIDKLESIPGFRTRLSSEEFVACVDKVGACIMAQSEDFVPADMKLYALRDVTATVESIPLITSSIMSKKLAEGIDGLVLDITVGNGAFMKTDSDAEKLAGAMIDIGKRAGKKVAAVLTDMNQPLGRAVGNAAEIVEVVDALKGEGPADLMNVVYCLGEEMLLLAGMEKARAAARKRLEECLASGRALAKLKEMVEMQKGNPRCIDDPRLMRVARKETGVECVQDGYVQEIDTYAIGSAFVELGGGRKTAGQQIDRSVGLMVNKKIGDSVKRGDVLVSILCDDVSRAREVSPVLASAYKTGRHKVEPPALIHKFVS
jgi:pyrimidine-nucleoside phosphorylase